MLKESLPKVFKACQDNAFADLIAAMDRPSHGGKSDPAYPARG
jgi:hypothetical protein